MSDEVQPKILSGTCLCGAAKYKITNPAPLHSIVCHCLNCKRWSGSAFAANILFPASSFSISDPSTLKTYKDCDNASGRSVERNFCRECGSPVYITSSHAPEMVSVMSGTLEVREEGDWEALRPKGEVFCQSRVAWVQIEGTEEVEMK